MNTPLKPTPSLLTLTAPTVERAPDDPTDGVFAEQLSAASEQSGDQREETDEAAPSVERADETAKAGDDPQSRADDGSSTPIGDEADHSEPIEEGLLTVSLVSETIVAETSPNANLPEHAATTVDVGLPEGPATPIVPPSDVAEGTEAGAAEALPETGKLADGEADQPGLNNKSLLDAEATADLNLNGELDSASEGRPAESTPGEVGKPIGPSIAAGPAEAASAAVAQASETPGSSTLETDEGDEPEPTTPPKSHAPQPSAGAEVPAADSTASTDGSPTREAVPATNPAVESSNDRPGVGRPAPAESRPTVDPARFVSRVSRAVAAAHERGGGPIEIRLSPPELGSLRVQIEMKEGMLSASLEAETPAARSTLLDNLPALRERLEQQQIRLEKFDVDVRDDSQQRGGGGAPEGENQRRSDDPSDGREPNPERRSERDSGEEETPREIVTITFDDDGLNLFA